MMNASQQSLLVDDEFEGLARSCNAFMLTGAKFEELCQNNPTAEVKGRRTAAVSNEFQREFTGGYSPMLVAHLASSMFVKIPMAALVLVQSSGGAQRFDLWQMWLHMQWPARSIAIILLGMSAWSMGVMMDR